MAAADKALSEEVGVLVEEDALRDVVGAKERPQGPAKGGTPTSYSQRH